MAAFCTCCGAAITAKSDRCLLCGAPRHGMKIISLPEREAAAEEPSKAPAGEPASKDRLSIA